MILIVISMHAVASGDVKIWNPVEEITHLSDVAVFSEISRVSFWHAHDCAVDYISPIDQTDLLKFARREIDEIRVTHRPKIIAFGAEVFEPKRNCRWIGHQGRTPIVENLQSPQSDIGLLNINPIIGRH